MSFWIEVNTQISWFMAFFPKNRNSRVIFNIFTEFFLHL